MSFFQKLYFRCIIFYIYLRKQIKYIYQHYYINDNNKH